MPHSESPMRCLVAHQDSKGHRLPACIRCAKCHEWIRPEDMSKDCKADERKEDASGIS